jgi:FtsP/CotA-like multicopper oxidase with cupredoxin domain
MQHSLRNFTILLLVMTGGGCNATSEGVPSVFGSDATATPPAPGGQPPWPGEPLQWDADFRLPEATDRNADPNIVEVSLEARPQNLRILTQSADGGPPPTTPMWTYNGSVPGPIIRTKKGNRLIVHFTNSLPEATTIHWHGVRVPNAMDGTSMVQRPVAPGGTFDYDFVVPDSGTYWYHPHLDSSAQVGYGLYGVLIVEDPSEPFLGDELTMVLSDVSVNPDGSMAAGDAQGWYGDYFGREGDVELVNGKPASSIALKMRAGMPQRWRVLDASRAKFQRFSLRDVSLTRIAGDEGLSGASYPLTYVDLTPGEREEVVAVADAPPGTTLTALEETVDRFHSGIPATPTPLFRVDVTDDPRWTGGPLVPASLASIVPLDVSRAPVREITFDEVTDRNDAGVLLDAGKYGGGTYLGINGVSSTDMSQMTTITTRAGATEIWNVTNNTTQDHPFHMHGYPFQVLSVGGAPPLVLEWRDNVKVSAKHNLRLAVSFDRPGMWMFHCHILDHADMGMMAMLVVKPADAGSADASADGP